MSLLCHDVDETLNTDDFSTFVSPELTEADVAHGSNPSCSYCHFGMDNQATALLGYFQDGTAQYDFTPIPSQRSHAFGKTGDGPRFLIQGYVERAPNINECLASKTWASLTGLSWDGALTDSQRADFVQSAKQGPKALIQRILTSTVLRLGSGASASEVRAEQ